MTENLLSVVIPAYNMEFYIEQCLRSVLKQVNDKNNIDIIIVIDGATDKTFDIAQCIVGEYPKVRTKIVTQHNLGLSGARNSGLSLVETYYVTFLDSDDCWLDGYLDTVMSVLRSLKPDMVEYDAMLTNEYGDPTSILKISSGPPGVTSSADHYSFLNIFRCYTWARIYRASLIRERPFPLGRRFEDTLTTPWIYWRSHDIVSLGVPLIGYRQRKDSILKRPTIDDVSDLSAAACEAFHEYELRKDNYWYAVAMRIFQQACARVIVLPIRMWPAAIKIVIACVPRAQLGRENMIRKLQINYTAIYIMLLYIKRNTFDRFR